VKLEEPVFNKPKARFRMTDARLMEVVEQNEELEWSAKAPRQYWDLQSCPQSGDIRRT